MALSPILGLPLTAPTALNKTVANNDLIVALEAATNDRLLVDMSGGNVTISDHDYTYHIVFRCNGLTADRTLTVPLSLAATGNPCPRLFGVRNASAHNVVVGGASGLTVTVPANSGALIESDGTDCFVFASGGSGPAGPSGPAGGAITIDYAFDTGTTNANPGSGKLRLNNATENTATALYVSDLDTGATDWSTVLDTFDSSTAVEKGQIRLVNLNDFTKWMILGVTGRTAHTGYREFAVTVLGSSATSPFAGAASLGLLFSRTGDLGSSIVSSNNTWTGRNVNTPAALTDAATIAVDFSLRNNFKVTLGGSRTLGNPTNQQEGQAGNITFTQDSSGGRSLTLDTQWFLSGGGPAILNTTANAISILTYYVASVGHIVCSIL